MHYTGIDISKKSLAAAVLDDEGEVVKSPVKLTVDQKGLAQLGNILESISTSKDKITAGIEATGNLSRECLLLLGGEGLPDPAD